MKLANVVLVGIPLVDATSFLHAVGKLALIVGDAAVDLPRLSTGQVVLPEAFVEQLGSRQLPVAVGLVVAYVAAVETAIFPDEQRLLALSHAVVEAALIQRAVVVDDPTEAVGQSVLPLALVVGTEVKEVVEV